MQNPNYKNKHILVGISGSAAVYKALQIVDLLKTHGALVKCVLTKNAENIISPDTLKTLAFESANSDTWDQMMHIELARWADLILIMPATANFIGKLACGLADDMLSTICLATTAPIVVAPAMNKVMWSQPVVQENLNKLHSWGVTIIGPIVGQQACGDFGQGRMAEPAFILDFLDTHFKKSKSLKGRKILITSGPTEESIDAVRFISNKSSGKMGCALANAAVKAGAKVLMISGPALYPHICEVIKVTTAVEMEEEVMKHVADYEIFISCAAVADYKIEKPSKHKLKKTGEPLVLTFVANPDIIKTVKTKFPNKICIGFAAETENLEVNALNKLKMKGLDCIVANLVGNGLAFGSDDNEVLIINKNGERVHVEPTSKTKVASIIVNYIAEIAKTNCE